MSVGRERLLLSVVLVVAAGAFVTGIHWGLPSRAADRFLFGGRTPWTGAQVQAMVDVAAARAWDDPARGADVDADPLAKTGRPVVLNADDAARAQIVRRYRLFTHQPDEMITLMALAKMRPGRLDLDPRLYQYGGMWVYPVGLLLKVASVVGYVDLRGGGGGGGAGSGALAYYLDRPEAFARFYVVARLYVALWGVVGAAAVFAIVRRITSSAWAACGAGLLFAVMPVVVNMAHEAKPHLPGTVLTLLAVLAGARYVETGRLAHAAAAGGLCGLAVGMVLSALPAFSVLVGMVLLRRMSWGDRLRVAVFGGLVGLVAYGLTNPYVVYHLLASVRGGPSPFASNLGNSSAFYTAGRPVEGAANVARLAVAGTSVAVAVAGAMGVVVLGARAVRARADGSPDAVRRRAHGLLLGLPAVLTAVQAALVGAGKPGEFGRFLLLPDVFLAVEAVALIHTYVRAGGAAVMIYGVVLLQTALGGARYVAGFVRDSGPETSRLAAARAIEADRQAGRVRRVLVTAEPAPYAVPAVNLFDLQAVLVPKGVDPVAVARPGDVVAAVAEGGTPIGWADKRVEVRTVTP